MSGCQVVNGFIVGNLLRLCGKNVPNSRLASNEEGNYPLVMKQFAMENGPFSSMFHLVKTIIVHGYVNLPEGRIYDIYIYIHSISSLYVPMVGLVPVKYPRCVYLSCSKLLYFLL